MKPLSGIFFCMVPLVFNVLMKVFWIFLVVESLHYITCISYLS